MLLCDEIVNTYIDGNKKAFEPVGRGWWPSHNPVEDYLAPETAFSDRRPSYKLPAGATDEAEALLR